MSEKPEDVGRSCTDAFWILPFLGCFGFLIWAYYYAVDHGNLLELTGLPNGNGLICGVSEPVATMPYLYMCPSQSPSYSDLVCVSQCPLSIEGQLAAGQCPHSDEPDYPSIAVANKVCFPTDSSRLANLNRLAFRFGLDSFLASMVEIQKAWPLFVLSGMLTIIFCFGHLKVFSQDPSLVFWANTGFFTVVLGFIGAVSVIDAVDLELSLGGPWSLLSNVEFLLGVASLACVSIFHIAVFFDRPNLENAFQAVKACGECTRDVPAILTEPVLAAARKVILLVNFAVGLMFFASAFDRVPDGATYQIHYQAKDLWLAAGFILAFLWVYDFSNAVSCFVYAYMSASWFYSPMEEKQFEGNSLLLDAYCAIVQNHLGSLAFGSLVILIMRPVRLVLDYTTRPIRKAEDEDANLCTKCAAALGCWNKVCEAAIQAYEKNIRKLRRSAYMDIALAGHGFIEAAHDADQYLAGKQVNVSEFDGAALLVATSSSFSISAVGAALTRLLCAVWPDYSSTSSPNLIMLPTFVSFISFVICMLISWPFCLLSDHVADSIFFCFCRDAWQYGFGTSDERGALNRGCNLQTLFGGVGSSMAVLTSSHPEHTQALKQAFDSMT